ncbi:YdcF family protein [Larsenimonas rhizosphaerae]|uniref:YdcF family protein n=1 Tax=Larsenimonas rhizosphaerae TaxID=2944682 RepID=UPI0020349093|nr:YdcF family protein [Larsenimonas rhizosphaerae]MCM2131160.1 YdcF family protein [Larsenimonas rhizosphaerae]
MLNLLKTFALPPGIFLVILLIILVLMPKWPRLMRWLGIATVALFWGLSMPPVASLLLKPIEHIGPSSVAQWKSAEAIVVLGGGRDYGAPELGWKDRTNPSSLQRLDEGARIARRTGLPILLSGGGKQGWTIKSEAQLMERSLEQEFGMSARWLENNSSNTEQNAQYSARILKKADIKRIVLVTTAYHMPRAMHNFEKEGLDVVPAPVGFSSDISGGEMWWAPQLDSLARSQLALHEYMGRLAGR